MKTSFKILIFAFILLNFKYLEGQNANTKYQYSMPLNIPLNLSGTFAELRNNHFHSGIDIKTNGITGLPVYNISDGYVSRIKVSSFGFGKALYITHSDGHTSVYAHLEKFNDSIQKIVLKNQYKNHDYEMDLYPAKNQIKFKKGELIAYSGNSGSSEGPHLHFEIRNSISEEPLNPMQYGFITDDTIRPVIKSIRLYPMIDNQILNPTEINIKQSINNFSFNDSIIFQLQNSDFFIGIEGFDQANDKSSINGFYSLEYFIDNKIFFRFKADKINFEDQRYINSYIDYSELKNSGKRYQRSFQEPNNRARNLEYFENKGVICINDTFVHRIKIIAKDNLGNNTEKTFKIQRKNMGSDYLPPQPYQNIFQWNTENAYKTDEIEVIIPSNSLYSNQNFYVNKLKNTASIYSSTFQIYDELIPVHKKIKLKLKVIKNSLPTSKLGIVYKPTTGNISFVGGKYNNGFIEAQIRDFGIYYIEADTIKPQIQWIGFEENKVVKSNQNINFKVSDNLSGIAKYEAYWGNQWVLLEYDVEKSELIYNADGYLLLGKNTFNINVIDKCGNETKQSFTFILE